LNKRKKLLKPFKFKELFERHGIEDCPLESVTSWTLDPIFDPLNFLPNILYNELRPSIKPRRMNAITDKNNVCGSCAISLFTSLDIAKAKFLTIKENSRIEIGYTNIAEGSIEHNDGLAGKIKHGHFNFYEFQGTDLVGKFVNIVEIT
jgi:hypothetical protein